MYNKAIYPKPKASACRAFASLIFARQSTPTTAQVCKTLEMINLNHIQRKMLATLVGFILSSLWLAKLDVDPLRIFELETDQIREYIVIPKSEMTKLERKGEAPWLEK